MSTRSTERTLRPVRRLDAERYLRYMLLCFAASVIGVRLFLELAGYPQVATGPLHIAHVLWGGLFLFVASLLPLLVANRWAYPWAAVFSGLGVGLFIDEVGKFITANNDYFFPPAAPIIYAFFLLTVLIYFRVRREPTDDLRHELYGAIDSLGDVLDHQLDARKLDALRARIGRAQDLADHPNIARLAEVLNDFVDSEYLELRKRTPSLRERMQDRGLSIERRWLSLTRQRFILIAAFALLGVSAFFDFVGLLVASIAPMNFERLIVVAQRGAEAPGGIAVFLLTTRFVLEGVVAGLFAFAAVFLALGRIRVGFAFGYFGLLLSLAVVNLLVFYFDQFAAIGVAVTQLVVLLGLVHYRRRHLQRRGEAEA